MGFRVLKTALAVVIAMYLAHIFEIISPAAAGLLAILGIEVTKKKGIQSALHRIGASMLALLTGSLLFMAIRVPCVGCEYFHPCRVPHPASAADYGGRCDGGCCDAASLRL